MILYYDAFRKCCCTKISVFGLEILQFYPFRYFKEKKSVNLKEREIRFYQLRCFREKKSTNICSY